MTFKTISFGVYTATAGYTLTVKRASRRFYNDGGVGISDATEIGFGAKVYGSLHHFEPGQFYKVENPGLAPIRAHGTLECPSGYYTSSFMVSLHRPDGTTVATKSQSCGGGGSDSPSFDFVFTPPAGTPATMYIKVRTGTWLISDFKMTVDGDLSKTLLIRGALGSQALSPIPGEGLPTFAYVPLGSVVKFVAVTAENSSVNSSFSLATNRIEQPSTLAEGALFKDRIAIVFSEREPNSVSMMAVHLGEATITITPDNGAIVPRSFRIVVQNPSALGPTNNQVDSYVNSVAHSVGVPPQFIKAQVDKESNFDPLAYRYEPIGLIGDLLTISRGNKYRRLNQAYMPYRLASETDADSPGLAVGTKTNIADIHVRTELRVECAADGSGGRQLTTADIGPVWASELLKCNDGPKSPFRANWKSAAGGKGERGRTRHKAVVESDFSAQTSLASSFGYLQVMYIDAIDSYPRWSGTTDDGGVTFLRNPSSLFDTEGNIIRGGGSLLIGTRKLVAKLKKAKLPAVATGQFVNYEGYVAAFTEAWKGYNADPSYAPGVAGLIAGYPLTAARALF